MEGRSNVSGRIGRPDRRGPWACGSYPSLGTGLSSVWRGFVGSIRTLGPIVEESASDLMYRPFELEGFTRRISSTTAR